MPRASADNSSPPDGPRAAARAAREEVYREHILAAAERVFAEKPFDEAKVQDISRMAELSMGSIYSLFAGKEQIFAAIIDKRSHEILELVKGVMKSDQEPLATLQALASAYIDYLYDHNDFLRMNLRTGAAWSLRPRTEQSVAAQIHEAQAEIFRRGIEAGVFVDEDPTYLATLFTGIDQIHLAHWVHHGLEQSREELREGFLRTVRRTFLRSPGRT